MIRTEQVGNMAYKSSANPKVRAHLLKLQRTLAEKNDVVMDGEMSAQPSFQTQK